ncbi:MAG: hemolysin family protein [Bacteroidota bacterium]
MTLLVFEVLLILLLILLNGVLALAEIALVSASRVRLQQRADGGDAGALAALETAADPTRFLSTVQVGITLVGILAGVFAGATVAEYLAAALGRLPSLAPYAEPLSLGIVVLVITYCTLVLGELLPKRIALTRPEAYASHTARPIRLLSRIAAPAVAVLTSSTDLLLRLLGIRQAAEAPVTLDEIKILLSQGRRAGVLEPSEQSIVEGALRLDELRVSALITARPEVVWLDLDAPPEKLQAAVLQSHHTHFPAAHGSLDNVAGVLRGRDVLARLIVGRPQEIAGMVKPAVCVPEGRSALKVLELFKSSGSHMILAIDEFGGLAGLVTLSDLMEALVGSIRTPGSPEEPAAIRREDGSWLLDGRMPVPELFDLLRIPDLLESPPPGVDTLGGLAMASLGRIPSPGDAFDCGGWRFEVTAMDGKRVDKVAAARSGLQGAPGKP